MYIQVSFGWFFWFTCRQIYHSHGWSGINITVSKVLYSFVGLISPQVWSPLERHFSFACRGWTLWHRTTNTKRFLASNIIWGRFFWRMIYELRRTSSLVKDGIDCPGEFMRNSSSPKRLSEDCVRWMVFSKVSAGWCFNSFFSTCPSWGN